MNKDRIQGSLEQAKGKVKEVAGKATGDSKLQAEGKTQQVAGKSAECRWRLQRRGEESRRQLTGPSDSACLARKIQTGVNR